MNVILGKLYRSQDRGNVHTNLGAGVTALLSETYYLTTNNPGGITDACKKATGKTSLGQSGRNRPSVSVYDLSRHAHGDFAIRCGTFERGMANNPQVND